jgi:hypothetical protein
MTDDQTPINARPKRRPPEAVEDLALALREHVLWPVEDWALGLSDRGRTWVAGGAVAAALVIGGGGFALVASGGSGSNGTQASEVVAVTPAPQPTEPAPEPRQAPEPTLQGAAPVFKPAPQGESKLGGSEEVSKEVEEEAAKAAAGNTGSAATDTISSTPNASATAARASTSVAPVEGPPAGPAAIAVARKFAGAFVDYEIGIEQSEVRKTFGETTTPELRRALLRRPPRQPAGVKVPKAKVLNVVPAPSHGTIYPVSVSLLRVGVTSELRLELEQLKNKEWRVVNALG